MDLILSIIEGAGLSASILSLAWIWRRGRLNSIFGVAGTLIFAFMLWQFVSVHIVHGPNVATLHQIDEIITGLFAMLAAGINTYIAGCPRTQINIGIDRRKSNVAHYHFNGNRDRRHTPTQSLHS